LCDAVSLLILLSSCRTLTKIESEGRQRPVGRISKRAVDAIVCPPGKDCEFLWDDALAGFGVAAFQSGKKTYVIQFLKAGRSRPIVIGDHGRPTPDEARSVAKKLMGGVEQGTDPVAVRRAERAVRSFREVTAHFLVAHVMDTRKPRTFVGYDTLLRRHINPALGAICIVEICRFHVARFQSSISDSPGAPTAPFPLSRRS
jgi:hypothetical protein